MILIRTIGAAPGAAPTMSALLVAFPGCEKQEGPMGQAGKKVAQGVENAGKQIEKAGDCIQEAAKVDKE